MESGKLTLDQKKGNNEIVERLEKPLAEEVERIVNP